jgi:hypothetical protein
VLGRASCSALKRSSSFTKTSRVTSSSKKEEFRFWMVVWRVVLQ